MLTKSARILPFTVLAAVVVSASAARSESVVFSDSFDGKLADGWRWVKQKKDAWRFNEVGLEFRVAGKDNVLARVLPEGDKGPYAVEVTLTSLPQPTRQYEQGGFTWLHKGRQVFKYVKERIDGKLYVFPGKKPMTAATVQLRLDVRGDKITAKFRPDAKGEWQEAFSRKTPTGEGEHLIGIMCYNGPQDAEHWMRFDNFRIVRLGE